MEDTKVSDKTYIPISWFFFTIGVAVSSTVASVLWISTVNYRLQRIEDKLGIPVYKAEIMAPETFRIVASSLKNVNTP